MFLIKFAPVPLSAKSVARVAVPESTVISKTSNASEFGVSTIPAGPPEAAAAVTVANTGTAPSAVPSEVSVASS